MKKICIVVGTRPEIIKMSPIIRLCEKENHPYYIIHTGQHYSYSLDKIFFEQLALPKPKFNLEVGSSSQTKQTSNILYKIEDVLLYERPDIILVQGDTNSVMGSALAASKLRIKIGHVEAGLRSFDRDMPEEINRVITDHISDYLYAPSMISKMNLLHEGIESKKILVTGNTISDALKDNLKIAKNTCNSIEKNNLNKMNYFLVTLHRPSNVDKEENLVTIFKALAEIANEHRIEVIFPIHPRTVKMINKYKIKYNNNVIKLIDPVSYLEFLLLENNAELILTDSGGIQEEACILKVPCITLRQNTERPETIYVGSNALAGADYDKILELTELMIKKPRNWDNPFGDGTASVKIINHINNI